MSVTLIRKYFEKRKLENKDEMYYIYEFYLDKRKVIIEIPSEYITFYKGFININFKDKLKENNLTELNENDKPDEILEKLLFFVEYSLERYSSFPKNLLLDDEI